MLRSIAKRSTFGIYLESVITRHVDFVCYLNLQFSQVFDNLGSSEFVGEKTMPEEHSVNKKNMSNVTN